MDHGDTQPHRLGWIPSKGTKPLMQPYPNSQISQCVRQISNNALFCNRNVHTHMCTFLLQNGALWDICLTHCEICEIQAVFAVNETEIFHLTISHWHSGRAMIKARPMCNVLLQNVKSSRESCYACPYYSMLNDHAKVDEIVKWAKS